MESTDSKSTQPSKNVSSETALSPRASERFYKVTEVGQSATPFSDWLVPLDVLRQSKVKEFVVRLWILETGEVLQADVLRMTPGDVPQAARDELSKWLVRTRTNPALKDGRPVASQRMIEVTLEL